MHNQSIRLKDNINKFHNKFKLSGIILSIFVIIFIVFFIFKIEKVNYNSKNTFKKMNIILITIDTLRADYLSCYKKNNAQTPNIDMLAGEGVIFEKCIAQSPLTLPSHTTILSGTYPLYHGVQDNGGMLVPSHLEFISEVLQNNGYTTSAFIAAFVLHSKWGINQGFNTFSDDFDISLLEQKGLTLETRADKIIGNAKKWIMNNKQNKFFSWIHLFDPHAKYEPPPPYNQKHPDNPYAGEVEYVDAQLGSFFTFLKEQDLYDNSIIILTADHGEGLWDHEERTHGLFVYNTTVWVPLIIRAPHIFPKKKIKRIVEHVDIAPTILDFLKITIPKSYQGVSLINLMNDQNIKKEAIAYTESFYSRLHFGWSELRAIYFNNWKFIDAPKAELYDLQNDEHEKTNLIDKFPSKKNKMKLELNKFIKKQSIKTQFKTKKVKLKREDRNALETLGYITSANVSTQKGKINIDPKDKVMFLQNYDKARFLMKEEKYIEAISSAKEVLKDEPDNVDILMILGTIYLRNNQNAEAINIFENVLIKKPDFNDAMIRLIKALIANNNMDQAEAQSIKFLSVFPTDHVLYNLLGEIYYLKKDNISAIKNFLKSLELETFNSDSLIRLGEIYLFQNKLEKAESYFYKSLNILHDLKNANLGLGRVNELRGDLKKAAEYYRKEIKINPENYMANVNLAEILLKSGNYKEAIRLFKTAININKEIKLPYISVCKYYFDREINTDETILLCKKLISIKPYDKSTLYGYFILTNIYGKTGNKKEYNVYSQKGSQLFKYLESQNKN